MPSHDFRLRAADGYPLQATFFSPSASSVPRAGVVLNSATGVHRRFYARFASFMAERFDLAVLTYDFRGIADSRPASFRAFNARIRDWPQLDMPAAVEWLTRELGTSRVSLVGHSAGGNLIGLMPNLDRVDAAVFVGSQLGYWRLWPKSIRHAMAATWHFAVPLFSRVFGYVPGWLGAGQHWPRGIAVELARWCRHPDYLFGDPSLDTTGYARFEAPILAWTFSDDPHASRAASEHLLARFPRADVTRRHVDPAELNVQRIGHFGFFRPFCEPLWQESGRWLSSVRGQDHGRCTPDESHPLPEQQAANDEFRTIQGLSGLVRETGR